MFLNTNLEEKKTLIIHPLIHYPLSRYDPPYSVSILNLFMILNLVLFPFGLIKHSIHLQLPGNSGQNLH